MCHGRKSESSNLGAWVCSLGVRCASLISSARTCAMFLLQRWQIMHHVDDPLQWDSIRASSGEVTSMDKLRHPR